MFKLYAHLVFNSAKQKKKKMKDANVIITFF